MRYQKPVKKIIRQLPPQYIKWWAIHKDESTKRPGADHIRLQKQHGALPTIQKRPP